MLHGEQLFNDSERTNNARKATGSPNLAPSFLTNSKYKYRYTAPGTQKHFMWTMDGPDSSYSALEIHIYRQNKETSFRCNRNAKEAEILYIYILRQ